MMGVYIQQAVDPRIWSVSGSAVPFTICRVRCRTQSRRYALPFGNVGFTNVGSRKRIVTT